MKIAEENISKKKRINENYRREYKKSKENKCKQPNICKY